MIYSTNKLMQLGIRADIILVLRGTFISLTYENIMYHTKHTLALSSAITALILGKIGTGPVDYDKFRAEIGVLIGDDPIAEDMLSRFYAAYNHQASMAEALDEVLAPFSANEAMMKALTCILAAKIFVSYEYEDCDAEIVDKINIIVTEDDDGNSDPGQATLELCPPGMGGLKC